MTNPVAWMDKYGNICLDIDKRMYKGKITATRNYHANDIPLYAHPIKELTDDEIIKEALDIGFLTNEDLTPEWAEYTQEFIASVRAILKKANEK